MKQELAWGTAATMAIVAAVGISLQSGNRTPSEAASTERSGVPKHAKRQPPDTSKAQSQCTEPISMLEQFFQQQPIVGPDTCYESSKAPANSGLGQQFEPEFIIATFPDPVHTHFALFFDRFVEALQQGLQDEGYQYDSSWLPWETEETSFALLEDQEKADDRKEKREDQPGILLFRDGDKPYQHPVIVFIVGEEPTRGIHRPQFQNAVKWIKKLRPNDDSLESVAMLGPSFSGSFPSLAESITNANGLTKLNRGAGVRIYSGSASSGKDGQNFADLGGVHFRSFVQDDETILSRFCQYLQRTNMIDSPSRFAILSEDETAYGNSGSEINTDTRNPTKESRNALATCPEATKIYFPRDISTLRAAYQNQSMFTSGSAQPNADNIQRKSLPTEIADSSTQQHDTVRTYAGNQTPLSQEGQLLGIVDVLRSHRTESILIRASNTLDSIFLANFLRRDYPEARVVILNSDLLFQRGQDAMALSGAMTLSTYPLFSWAREWSAAPSHGVHSHRVFSENSTEGTYIASRLLVQSLDMAKGRVPALRCYFTDKDPERPNIFVPPLACEPAPGHESGPYAPMPDYAPPYWAQTKSDTDQSSLSRKPATWLSVITRNGTWPLAVLNEHATVTAAEVSDGAPKTTASKESDESTEHRRWPDTPRSTKIWLVVLCCLALFHASCCHFASFTAKPAFRAHFATADWRHTGLVLSGSYVIALMALVTGWGCGVFAAGDTLPIDVWPIRTVVIFVCLVAGFAIVSNIIVTGKLNGDGTHTKVESIVKLIVSLPLFCFAIWAFFAFFVYPLEDKLSLASRMFAYWRSMNLTSGVSPIVPFLSLSMGLYLWFWYALHGLALFGPDRPHLPPIETLKIEFEDKKKEKRTLELGMFSDEKAGKPIEESALPLAKGNRILISALFVIIFLLAYALTGKIPLRSLGASRYAYIVCIALNFYFCLIVTEGWQIWRTWSGARNLLVFLDRLALRRTISSLRGFSWGSVWRMSGNVLDVRYKLLSRQLESVNHLRRSFSEFKLPQSPEESSAYVNIFDCIESVNRSHEAGIDFGEWYSSHYNDPNAADLRKFEIFQTQIAETTGVLLTKLLVPTTRVEEHSLIQGNPGENHDQESQGPRPSKNELIRNAEELVCLTYLGYAQNLLGRIRTIVLGGIWLFIAATIAASSYPFDPRPLLSGVLLFLFAGFGSVVVFTYADMHRDTTLSHLTNTEPGKLGSEFWLKMIGFGAAPLLGLITQVFPEWSGFLFSWLQPGLSSLK